MLERYFVASNSSEGFCSYYDSAFDASKLSKIYVIKGGSGTGKSFFMRKVAECAESVGCSVRYIYCSSDAESLDGIIIKELKIAVLDGTAPHICEPGAIGACESFINLGDFLDEDKLVLKRGLIERVSKEKQNCFERAYRALLAYRTLSENIADIVSPAIKRDKLKKFVNRFIQNIDTDGCDEEILLIRSIGMRGLSSFDTYFEQARIYYEISDYFESAHFLMDEIYRQAKEKEVGIRISRHPIIKDRIDALCAMREGLTFEIGNGMNDGARIVNMKRFLDMGHISSIRQDYRTAVRARDQALDVALCEFEKVKEHHFLLEEIYGAAMDFEAKERFTCGFCNKIFQKNCN